MEKDTSSSLSADAKPSSSTSPTDAKLPSSTSSRQEANLLPSASLPDSSRHPIPYEVPAHLEYAFVSPPWPTIYKQRAGIMEDEVSSPSTPPWPGQKESPPNSPPGNPFSNFAGVSGEAGQAGLLSLFHTLENDGELSDLEEEDESIRTAYLQPAVKDFVKPSLAAVALWIPVLHPASSPTSDTIRTGNNMMLSGFRVGKQTILTCAHFAEWPADEEAFNVLAREYVNKELKVEMLGFQKRVFKTNQNKAYALTLQLVALHKPWDMAVFRIAHTGDYVDLEMNEIVIDPDQISYWEGSQAKLSSGTTLWWSAGYNGGCTRETFSQSWMDAWNCLSANSQTKIREKYKYDQINPPETHYLRPHSRSVSFGILGNDSVTGLADSDDDTNPHRVGINLSAWHGRSGSMVCTLGDDGNVRVFGMMAGGLTGSSNNAMYVFKREMKPWLDAALEVRDDLHTNAEEYAKRFVMSLETTHHG